MFEEEGAGSEEGEAADDAATTDEAEGEVNPRRDATSLPLLIWTRGFIKDIRSATQRELASFNEERDGIPSRCLAIELPRPRTEAVCIAVFQTTIYIDAGS